jgi:hypothetical protein
MRFDQLNSARSSCWPVLQRLAPLGLHVCLIAVAMCFVFIPIARAADSPAKDPSAALWAAVIAGLLSMAGLIFQLWYNAREARRVEKATAAAEHDQRQRELALKIADLVGKDRAAARRFAIGLVKVEKVGDYAQTEKSDVRGKIYFIPVNSRFSVGRDPENDIHLAEPNLGDLNLELSRYQCGFVADQQNVVVEDFNSANGTFVNDPSGDKSVDLQEGSVKFAKVRRRTLADRDCIWIGPFVLRFIKLQENKILFT